MTPLNLKADDLNDTGTHAGIESNEMPMHDVNSNVQTLEHQHSSSDDNDSTEGLDIQIDSSSHSGHPSEGDCSNKCVLLKGNLESTTRVDSPITWLVDACVHLKLFPAHLQKKHNDEAIAHWQTRDGSKHSAADRHKTGGGITNTQFWPEILKTIRQNIASSPSSIPMVFTDFGSELFLQGLLCALLGDFQDVVGIEINIDTFDKSVQLSKWLIQRATSEGKFISNIQLHHGSFLNHNAILDVTARSSVVYANNFVFGDNINIPLVALWQKHLPAGASMVVFDETAILSSECTRMSRGTHDKIQWTRKIARTTVSVSWRAGEQIPIHVWQVSTDYKKLRNWAAAASFEDLLGWAIYHGKACLMDGAKRSSLWPETFAVILDTTTWHKQLSSALENDASSIFLAITSSHEAYFAAFVKVSSQLQDPSSRINLHSFCVVDCSEHNPVVTALMQQIERRK